MQYTTMAPTPTVVPPTDFRVIVTVPNTEITQQQRRYILDRASVALAEAAQTETEMGLQIATCLRSVRYDGGLEYYFASPEIAELAVRTINRYIDFAQARVDTTYPPTKRV